MKKLSTIIFLVAIISCKKTAVNNEGEWYTNFGDPRSFEPLVNAYRIDWTEDWGQIECAKSYNILLPIVHDAVMNANTVELPK